MPDKALSEALKEAYALAPVADPVLHTLELRYGNSLTLRVVADNAPLQARLESSAPRDGGRLVDFSPWPFLFTLPEVATSAHPEIRVVVDNIGSRLTAALDRVSADGEALALTYRPYLRKSAGRGPEMNPPLHLEVANATATPLQVVLRARLLDIGNLSFPNEEYTARDFPGLARWSG